MVKRVFGAVEEGIAVAELVILCVLLLLLVLGGIRLFGGSIFFEEETGIKASSGEVIELPLENSTIQEGGAITTKQESTN